MQADGSPMDGQRWRDLGPDKGLDHWQWTERPQLSVQPSNRPAIVINQEYNDLDLMAMGVITADEAYASTGGRFSWMEPWYSAPLPFLAGVFVAFSAQDFLYFGFDSDHRKLGVSRTDGTRYGEADLGADYHPWPGRGNTGVALRVLLRLSGPGPSPYPDKGSAVIRYAGALHHNRPAAAICTLNFCAALLPFRSS